MHANWLRDIVQMFTLFFNEVQQYYEAGAKPITGFYTISQAVYKLRNKFHAHLEYHKKALVLSLDTSKLNRIHEQLLAVCDDQVLRFNPYRIDQREVHYLPLLKSLFFLPFSC